MTYSSLYSSVWASVLIAVASLLSACSFRGASKPASAQNEIAIREFKLLSSPTTTLFNAYGFPIEKVYHIETCLQDTATNTNARGITFQLQRNGKARPPVTADSNGCVVIDLTSDFDPLAPNNFIIREDKLIHGSAEVDLKYAYNPWSQKNEPEFLDLRPNRQTKRPPNLVEASYEKEALVGAKPFDSEQYFKDRPSNLSFSKGEGFLLPATATESGRPQRQIDLHLQGTLLRPGPTRKNFEELVPKEGTEQVQLLFVSYSNKSDAPVSLTRVQTVEGVWKQGILDVKLQTEFVNQPEDENDIVKLVYLVWPATPLERHIPAAGKLNVNLLSGTISDRPTELSKNEVRDFFGLPLLEGQKGTITNKEFLIADYDLVREEDSRTVEPNSWSASERAKLNISMVDSLSHRPLRYKEFEVEFRTKPNVASTEIKKPRTDDKGVLRLTVEVNFPLADRRQYLRRWIVVRSRNSGSVVESSPIEIGVNPWKKGTGFFKDTARLPSSVSSEAEVSEPAEFDLQAFSHIFLGRSKGLRFRVGNNLEFTQFRHYHFYLSPNLRWEDSVETNGSIEKAEHPEPLPPDVRIYAVGAFLAGSIDETPNLESTEFNKRIISGFRTPIGIARSGKVVLDAFLPIAFKDLARVEGRTTLILEINPDGAKGAVLPERRRYLINFKSVLPDKDSSNGPPPEFVRSNYMDSRGLEGQLREASFLEAQPLDQGTVYRRKERKESGKKLFVDYWKTFAPVSELELGLQGDDQNWTTWDNNRRLKTAANFRKLIEDRLKLRPPEAVLAPTEILREFCRDLEHKNIPTYACQENPLQFFNLNTFELVQSINDNDPTPVKAEPRFFNKAVNFFKELQKTRKYSEGNRNAVSVSAGVQANIGYEHFGNGVKFNASVQRANDLFSMEEVAVQEGIRTRIGSQQSQSLHSDEFVLSMQGNSQYCLFVRPLSIARELYGLDSYLFCGPVTPRTIQEAWFYTRDLTAEQSSELIDSRDQLLPGFSIVHRGSSVFKAWEDYALNGKVAGFKFERIEPVRNGVEAFLEVDFKNVAARLEMREDGGIFPSLVHYNESTRQKWSEVQIWNLTEKCGAEAGGSERAYRFCRCIYEAAALEWSFEEFDENSEPKLETLRKNETQNRCKQLAKKPRINNG